MEACDSCKNVISHPLYAELFWFMFKLAHTGQSLADTLLINGASSWGQNKSSSSISAGQKREQTWCQENISHVCPEILVKNGMSNGSSTKVAPLNVLSLAEWS